MSGFHPYCIVTAGCHPPQGLTGLDGASVHGFDVGRFTVWVSEERAAPPADLERVTAHHAVVAAAVAATTALPVRFGSWVPSHEALAARIQESGDDLEAALASAAGRIEMGVSVRDVASPPEVPERRNAPRTVDGAYPDGRSYLRALSRSYSVRHERRRQQDEVAAEIARRLAEVAPETRVQYPEPPALLSVAHLIARGDEARYRSLLAGLGRTPQYAGRLHVTGPWPPYSFATT